MRDYTKNSKKMSPSGDAVAIRTILPADDRFANQQWLVAYSGFEGAQHRSNDDVADWPDIPEVIG